MSYIYGAVIALILALSGATWYQSGVIEHLKGDSAQLTADALKCAAANEDRRAVIVELVKARDKVVINCESRLAAKDTIIEQLRDIEIITGGCHGQNMGDGNGGADNNSDIDHIGNALAGMLPMVPAGNSGSSGVHKADGAANTSGTYLLPGQLVHCLDEVNAKNLLRNTILLRGWALDMQKILTSFQTGT